MRHDLEQALRDSGAELRLTTPPEAILARGERLRRRRHRVLGSTAAGVLGVAAAAATAAMPLESGLAPPAVAAFSGPSTNLTAAQLAAVSDACVTEFRRPQATVDHRPEGIWDIRPGSTPRAAEIRGDVAQAYFTQGHERGFCTLTQRGDGTFAVSAQGWGSVEPLGEGDDLRLQAVHYGDAGEMGGPLSEIAAVADVSSAVERAEMVIGAETVEGYVSNDVAFFWASNGYSPSELETASYRAFDAGGAMLADEWFSEMHR